MDNLTLKTLADRAGLYWPYVDCQHRDAIILSELCSTPKLKADPNLWDHCWSQVLQEYASVDFDWSLVPYHYKKPTPYARFCGKYISVATNLFVYELWCALREYVFQTYLKDTPEVREYGCGSGLNLLALSKLHPGKKLVGYDVSESAVATVKLIAERHPEISLRGRKYSFIDGFDTGFTGICDVESAAPFKGHAVLTCGALEQVGKKWQPFLNLIMWQQPSICVHVEPLLELYDETILFDWLAARYHCSRGYLEGYLPAIQQLEKDGRAEIITAERVQFGNVHNEGFSLLVWRPK